MDKQKATLLGLLGLLVIGLYLISVGIGSGGGKADPENSGGIEGLDGFLANLPGLGRTLDSDDVEPNRDCFDGTEFRLNDGLRRCSFDIAPDIDRVRLEPRHAACVVELTDQQGAIDQRLDLSDVNSDGELRLGLTGEGARVTMSIGFSANLCIVRLLD